MNIFSLPGKSAKRHTVFCLVVVAIGLSTLFASSSRAHTPAVPTGCRLMLKTDPAGAGVSPAGPVAVAFNKSSAAGSGTAGDLYGAACGAGNSVAVAGLQGIILTRPSLLNTLSPASASFNIGSYEYSSNGTLHTMDVAPFMKNNRAYLPVRYMGYAIGMSDADMSWDPDRETASFRFDSHTVVFALGSTTYTIDGVAHTMDVEPVVVDGRINIPAAYFANAFGYNVIWNQEAGPAPPTDQKPDQTPGPHSVFVVVDTRIPEHLYVYRDTSVILSTYCNTGIPGAATPTGVFDVFAKMPCDTMTGTNLDGSKYFDRDVPWVMYFYGGCAIHGFVRAGYGFPQSLGCVELPVEAARKVYDLVPVGTPVYIK